ncbi:UNVERIFIED_CONTAM: hypothetical protein NCL1_15731 [Trichonephila clavipes]
MRLISIHPGIFHRKEIQAVIFYSHHQVIYIGRVLVQDSDREVQETFPLEKNRNRYTSREMDGQWAFYSPIYIHRGH